MLISKINSKLKNQNENENKNLNQKSYLKLC